MRLILASTSRYRRELLTRLCVPFACSAPACDEEALKIDGEEPQRMVRRLAREKALSVARSEPDAFVIGSDQAVEFRGQTLGKPGTRERALAQLSQLSGATHRLLTAVCLVSPQGGVREHLDVHELTLRPLPDAALQRYLDVDAPLDCAGSYKIEASGIALFSRIEGDDFTAITGLPLIALTTMLSEAGFSLP